MPSVLPSAWIGHKNSFLLGFCLKKSGIQTALALTKRPAASLPFRHRLSRGCSWNYARKSIWPESINSLAPLTEHPLGDFILDRQRANPTPSQDAVDFVRLYFIGFQALQ